MRIFRDAAILHGAALALAASIALGALAPQRALGQSVVTAMPSQLTPRQVLSFEMGAGRVVTLGQPAANIFVADPRIAEVRPGSASTLFIFGVAPGRTTIAALDEAGLPVGEFEVTVLPAARVANEAQAAVTRLVPGARLRVEAQPKGLLVSGEAATPQDAARALAILRGYLLENQVLEDQIAVASPAQITLRVRIAEMSRSVTRSMGVNWQAIGTIGTIGTFPAAILNANASTLACPSPISVACRGVGFNGVIDALAQDNLARVLAEPNLTVMSGQSASFLAGGEFPIPVGQQAGQITIEFKKYGVNLSFLPTVLSPGRIHLKVTPEVSQLTDQGSVKLAAGNATIQIPALTVRRAETVVELGSGQSFAIAGLLQDNVNQTDSGLPGLGDVPVLGALFRSDKFLRNETELVIVVTPYIVRPVDDPTTLKLPGESFVPPTDLERILLLRQVGRPPAAAAPRLPGHAGFIMQ